MLFRSAFKNAMAHSQPVVPLRLRRMNRFEYGNAVRDLFDLKSWVYSINDRIIRDHNNYFRPETGKMPKVARVGNRIMGLQQLLENRLLGVMAFPKDPPAENGFNNRGDHLSLTPTLMESFLELSRSVVNAENFDKNCQTWNDLFQDPSKKPSTTGFGSITADKSVATHSTGLIATFGGGNMVQSNSMTIAFTDQFATQKYYNDTPLSGLNNGAEISVQEGTDFIIKTRDGKAIEIDISRAGTVGDLINAINLHPAGSPDSPNSVFAEIATDKNSIEFTDYTDGKHEFTLIDTNDGKLIGELGFVNGDGKIGRASCRERV